MLSQSISTAWAVAVLRRYWNQETTGQVEIGCYDLHQRLSWNRLTLRLLALDWAPSYCFPIRIVFRLSLPPLIAPFFLLSICLDSQSSSLRKLRQRNPCRKSCHNHQLDLSDLGRINIHLTTRTLIAFASLHKSYLFRFCLRYVWKTSCFNHYKIHHTNIFRSLALSDHHLLSTWNLSGLERALRAIKRSKIFQP